MELLCGGEAKVSRICNECEIVTILFPTFYCVLAFCQQYDSLSIKQKEHYTVACQYEHYFLGLEKELLAPIVGKILFANTGCIRKSRQF